MGAARSTKGPPCCGESEAVREARHRGSIDSAALDALLMCDPSTLAFEACVRRLARSLEEVELELPSGAERKDGPYFFDAALRAALRDGQLAGYTREIARIPRMERTDEMRLGRRFDFVRLRLRHALKAAGLRKAVIEEILESSRVPAMTAEHRVDDPRVVRAVQEVTSVRREWVERNLHVVVAAALQYRTYGVPLLDLVQEGNAGLIRAVEKFDWRKSVLFRTYATFWVRQAIERAIASAKGIVRVPNYLQQKMRRLRREGILPKRNEEVSVLEVSRAFEVSPRVASRLLETERTARSLDVVFGGEDREPLAASLADDETEPFLPPWEVPLLERRLREVLDELPDVERDILELRYGLNGRQPETLEEVGRRMNVSRERVRQLQVRALKALQTPSMLSRLDCFV